MSICRGEIMTAAQKRALFRMGKKRGVPREVMTSIAKQADGLGEWPHANRPHVRLPRWRRLPLPCRDPCFVRSVCCPCRVLHAPPESYGGRSREEWRGVERSRELRVDGVPPPCTLRLSIIRHKDNLMRSAGPCPRTAARPC
eukprot:SAG31_NODE_835_length_11646_cov_11.142201_4_plen_142_part_00